MDGKFDLSSIFYLFKTFFCDFYLFTLLFYTRTAVNSQSNSVTPLNGVFTGVAVIFALQFMTSAFQFIPASALAAVIIMAVINMFDLQIMKTIWKVNSESVYFLSYDRIHPWGFPLFCWKCFVSRYFFSVTGIDFLPLAVTFCLCFWDFAYGIIAGIAVSLLILLSTHAR